MTNNKGKRVMYGYGLFYRNYNIYGLLPTTSLFGPFSNNIEIQVKHSCSRLLRCFFFTYEKVIVLLLIREVK